MLEKGAGFMLGKGELCKGGEKEDGEGLKKVKGGKIT